MSSKTFEDAPVWALKNVACYLLHVLFSFPKILLNTWETLKKASLFSWIQTWFYILFFEMIIIKKYPSDATLKTRKQNNFLIIYYHRKKYLPFLVFHQTITQMFLKAE